MHGEGEPAILHRRPPVGGAGVVATKQPGETLAERAILVAIPQEAKTASDRLDAALRLTNHPPRPLDWHRALDDRVQEGTAEPAAARGPLPVDPAAAVLTQRGTRLRELVGNGASDAGSLEPEPELAQPRRVVGRLEFDVLEQHAVAAEAAGDAEALRGAGSDRLQATVISLQR